MESTFLEKLKHLNQSAGDVPRKLLVILCVLGLVWVLAQLFPYVAPFVLALVLTILMSPLVRLFSRAFAKVHLPRALATLLSMLLVFGVLLLVFLSMLSRGFVELKNLASMLPRYANEIVTWFNTSMDELAAWLTTRVDVVDPESIQVIRDYLNDLGRTLVSAATSLANSVARRAVSTAISLPQILLFIMLTIMGTFYMSYDKERILGYFKRLLPQRASNLAGQMKSGMFRAVLGQLRAQVILTSVLFLELLIGLSILGIDYALLLALVIALMDALPVIGAGLFLLPWSVFGFVVGDMRVGFGMLILYALGIVVRQLLEPRVVGAQLGIYPLATMMSMYAGFVMFGFLGMLFGPMIFMLCRVAVVAVTEDPANLQPATTGVDRVKERAQETVSRLRERQKKQDGDKPE